MRLLDVKEDNVVKLGQLYLTESEAHKLVKDLQSLLVEPEACKHHHLISDDGGSELSYSIVTQKKLNNVTDSKYSQRELNVLLKHE